MIILKREMSSTENYKILDYGNTCQASINSDKNIVLRIYNPENKEKDEIIILSKEETDAIFDLMYAIHEKTNKNVLPF